MRNPKHRFLILCSSLFCAGLVVVSAQENKGNQPENDQVQSSSSDKGLQNAVAIIARPSENVPIGKTDHGSGGSGQQGPTDENKGSQSENDRVPSGSGDKGPQAADPPIVRPSGNDPIGRTDHGSGGSGQQRPAQVKKGNQPENDRARSDSGNKGSQDTRPRNARPSKNVSTGKSNKGFGGSRQQDSLSNSEGDVKVKGKYNGKGNASSWTPEKWTPQKTAEMKQRMVSKNKVYGGGQERGGPPWMRIQGGSATGQRGSTAGSSSPVKLGIAHQQYRNASSIKVGRLPFENSGRTAANLKPGSKVSRGLSVQRGGHPEMETVALGGLLSGLLTGRELSLNDHAPGSRSRGISSRSSRSLNSASGRPVSRNGFSSGSKSTGIASRNDRFKRAERGGSPVRGGRLSGAQTGVCLTGTSSLGDILFGGGSSGQSNQIIASRGGRPSGSSSRATASRGSRPSGSSSRVIASRGSRPSGSSSRVIASRPSRPSGSSRRGNLSRDSRASGAPSKGLTSRAGLTMGSTRHGNVSSGSRSMGSTSRGNVSRGGRPSR